MVDEHDDAERPGGPGQTAGDARVDSGIDHLQAAAVQLIGAARALLDVMEEVVADRDKMADAMTTIGSFVESAARGARRAGFEPFGSGERAASTGREAPADTSRVQHIRVS